MPAPTEQDRSKTEKVLRREFPDWDEEDYLRVSAAVLRKRSRINKGGFRMALNDMWKSDGSCSFEDMEAWLVTDNKSQERTRLARDTAKEFGWVIEKKGKVWFATKEGTVPEKYRKLTKLAKREGGVCPIQAGFARAGSVEYTKAVEHLLNDGAENIGSGYYRIEE